MLTKNKSSVIKELKLKLMIAILILLFFCLFVFGINSYQEALKLAAEDVKRHSNSVALDMQNVLGKQMFQFSTFSDSKIFAELSRNILYTQYANRELKKLVDNNLLIDAAFISDGSEYIVEGFPLATLRFNNLGVINYTLDKLAKQNPLLKIELAYFDDKIDGLQNDTVGSLFIAIPLRSSNASLINPFDTTGVLFLLVNPEELTSKEKKLPYSNLKIIVNDKVWYGITNVQGKSTINIEEAVFDQDSDGQNVVVGVEHAKSYYTERVFSSIFYSSMVIALLFYIMFLYISRLSRRIINPITTLNKLATRLKEGQYQIPHKESEFIEFEQVYQTITHLADTITNQIKDLEQQRQRAEESEQVKANFLANMSHEIRTPMNGILGTLQVLQRQAIPFEAHQLVEKGLLSSKTLLTIVNDILDFSKIEAGRLTLESIPLDVSKLVELTVADLQPIAEAKHIKMTISHSEGYKEGWLGDPVRLKQIILNIMSNAVKFTDRGKVSLEISDQHDQLCLEVADNGIGMSKHIVDGLFSRFEQADKSTTRRYGGTGLGMAITKQLVDLMDGTIKVESELNVGTKFIVCLPLHRQSMSAVKKLRKTFSETPNLTGKTILVAEDNKINQSVFLAMIKPTHAKVIVAEDGLEAIALHEQYKPDMIFMDIQMPNMDGIDACLKIKEVDSKTPIVALTANVMNEDVKKYMRTGFTSHLGKPVELSLLYRELSFHLLED
jgi:two-component system, sensor histidine kinase